MRVASLSIAWLVLVAHCLLTASSNPLENTAIVPTGRTHRRGILSRAPGVLLVGKIDGTISALSEDSGSILWTFDSGSPLITTSHNVASKAQVFPGIDGSIFVLHDQNSPKLELSKVTVAELVENSPSLTADGSVISGSLETTLYYIDSKTGTLLRSVPNAQTLEEEITDTPDQAIIVARKDYKIESLEPDLSTSRWKISFSEFHYLHVTSVFQENALVHYVEGSDGQPAYSFSALSLTTGEDNSLHARDSTTGWLKWSVSFTSAPVVAYSLENGGRSMLSWNQGLQDGRMASGNEFWKSRSSKVMVGSVATGGLYALPVPTSTAAQIDKTSPQSLNPGDKELLELIEGGGSEMDSLKCIMVEVTRPSEETLATQWLPQIVETELLTDKFETGGVLIGVLITFAVMGCVSLFKMARRKPEKEKLQSRDLLDRLRRRSGTKVDTEPAPTLCDSTETRAKSEGKEALSPRVTLAPLKTTPLYITRQQTRQKPLTKKRRMNSAEDIKSSDHESAKQLLPSQEDLLRGSSVPSSFLYQDEHFILGASLLNQLNEPGDYDSPKLGRPSLLPSTLFGVDDIFDSASSSSQSASPILANYASPHQQFLNDALFERTLLNEYRKLQIYNFVHYAGMSTSSISALPALSTTKSNLSSFSTMGFDPSLMPAARNQVFKVGKLTCGPGILGEGSGGTIVFDGEFQGRPVAVKRVLKNYYNLAANEKDILILSDEHPNLVRLFAVEEDKEFVFLALERCKMNLSDFISSDEGAATLRNPNNSPTTACYSILRGVVEGLSSLHSRGIVHRDLKPHNVLMTEDGRAKLSDMGLCRRMVADQKSFICTSGAGGSSGWLAPEQLIVRDGGKARQTKAMDIFSLGCVMYQCLSGGSHPFGENYYKRDDNILKSNPYLDALDEFPEAMDLISAMLNKDPSKRPSIEEVKAHPFWWTEGRKLHFLIELSDRIENEDRQEDKTLLQTFEAMASAATGGNWGARLDALLVKNLGQFRKYNFTSLRDLLRVVRNKHNHYRELPADLKEQMGPVPEGYYKYFADRFPQLLMTAYAFARDNIREETQMEKYFASDLMGRSSGDESVSTPTSMPTIDEIGGQFSNSRSSGPPSEDEVSSSESVAESPKLQVRTKPPIPPVRTISGDSSLSAASPGVANWGAVLNVIRENACRNSTEQEAGQFTAKTTGGLVSPLRTDRTPVTAPDGGFFSARTVPRSPASHPRAFNSLISTDKEEDKKEADPYKELQSPIKLSSVNKYEDPTKPIVGWEEDPLNTNSTLLPFPQRPGTPICDFYQKTGFCKYHERCRYHHPMELAVRLNEDGLPIRPGDKICEFYKNTHNCKFGGACKYHHPNMKPIYAGSISSQGRPAF